MTAFPLSAPVRRAPHRDPGAQRRPRVTPRPVRLAVSGPGGPRSGKVLTAHQLTQGLRAAKVACVTRAWARPSAVRHGLDTVGFGIGVAGTVLSFFSPFGYVLAAVGVGLHLGIHGPYMVERVRNKDGSVAPEATLFRWSLLAAALSSLAFCLIAASSLGPSAPVGLGLIIVGHAAVVLALGALVYRNRRAGGVLPCLGGACRDGWSLAMKNTLPELPAARRRPAATGAGLVAA